MASFDAFLPTLLRFEGGFVDDPADPGGATNKGITMLTFQEAAQPLLDKAPTLENLKGLSDEDAGTLYRGLYWDQVRADEFEAQDLADIVVDFCVNAGCSTGIKLLQRVLNEAGTSPALGVEGLMGPATLRAIQNADPRDVYRRYRTARIAYYNELVADKPQLQRFLGGWMHRVSAFPEA
jgi:lysozyme family protein